MAFGNDRWFQKFQDIHVKHLARTRSDNPPILISVKDEGFRAVNENPFKIQVSLFLHPKFVDLIKAHWQRISGDFVQVAKELSTVAKKWNTNVIL